jgi:hypothetical protein
MTAQFILRVKNPALKKTVDPAREANYPIIHQFRGLGRRSETAP